LAKIVLSDIMGKHKKLEKRKFQKKKGNSKWEEL